MPSFTELTREFLDERYEDAPVMASGLGLDRFDHRLDDLSESAFEGRRWRATAWLGRFEGIGDEGLTFDQRIDRDLILSVLRGQQVMDGWQMWRRQPATYLNPGLNGVFSLFLHRLKPEADLAAAAAARLRAVPETLAAGRRNLQPELAPPIYVERAIGQARAAVTYARDLIAAEVADPALQGQIAEAGAIAAAAFEQFAAFLEDLRGRASGEWAIGEARYSRLLTDQELLGYGAAGMKQRGQQEYDRLAEELRRLAHEVSGSDDWAALLTQLNQDHPATPAAMRASYADWTERARQFLKDWQLVTFPEGERCAVEPSPPFQRPVIAVASYQTPPPFSSLLTGHFFVPYPPEGVSDAEVQQRLEYNSATFIPVVAVHEAYPGHHWHLVTTKRNPSEPRHVFRTAYFAEGWALYAERMMREQGFFTDPRQQIRLVESSLFRAARIIVDTSLHTGEMTFEEGVRFMIERANLPEPTARAEAGRYCSWPTQASSYLTGCLEILRIRDRYLAQTSSTGVDALRAFHDRLALSGCLPIALAERAVLAASNGGGNP